MINLTQDLYNFLSSYSSITSMTGNRIWGDRRTPPKTYRPNDGPAICFHAIGGYVHYNGVTWRAGYRIKHYGDTDDPTQSGSLIGYKLYGAVHDVLHQASFGHVRFARCIMLPQALEEYLVYWPYVLGSYELVAING